MRLDPHAKWLVPFALIAQLACSDKADPVAATSPSEAMPNTTGGTTASKPPVSSGQAGAKASGGASAKRASDSAGAGDSAAANSGSPPAAGASEPAAGSGGSSGKPKPPPPPGSVSKPGEYSGYGDKIYNDGYALTSEYVPMRDGTKLAFDFYRPKGEDGKVIETPLPVLWMHTPYNRRTFTSGLSGESYPGFAARLIPWGYVVAIVDYRGVYASYGKNAGYNRGEWMDAARMDAYDITEWLAMQPWSTGKIGMWGCSATGGSQMQALTVAPPHLRAVFPMSCEFDVYPFGVPGGMSAAAGDTKAPPMASSAALRDATAAAVDADTGGAQLRAATGAHAGNIENPGYVPFRDSTATNIPEVWWAKSSPHTYLDVVNGGAIAAYVAANWDEAATKYGAFFTVNNLTNPTKLVVGPGAHCAWTDVMSKTGFDITVEERRFFDYWLKDVENGVMDEDKVYYYTYNAPTGKEWRSAPAWPLPNEKRVPYYLGAKTLATVAPTDAMAKDDSMVDYNVTTGATSTTAPPDPKGVAYTSEPLAADLLVTGHPVVELWVASSATDGDFIATLQDVDANGTITSYNMHGRLRASLRKEEPAPYNNLQLPWHPFRSTDVTPLVAGEPTLLKFDLLPLSFVFKAGHRIQVTLSFADTITPRITPTPTVSIYHDATHPSLITLPVIEE